MLAGGERGLLWLAFAPDYATTGLVYVYLTAQVRPRASSRSASCGAPPTPTAPCPGAGRLVLAVPHPDTNHNGGQLAFGPDGMLYAATGDGGGSNDLENDAAETDSLLGKILRIDPRRGAARTPAQPVRQRGLGLRAAQPVALLVRPRHRRPRDRRRRPGRQRGGRLGPRVRRRRARRQLRLALLRGHDPDAGQPERPRLGAALLARDAARPQPPALERDHDATASARSSAASSCATRACRRSPGRYLLRRQLPERRCDSAVLGAPEGPADTGLAVPALTSFGEDACGRVHIASLDGTVSRLQDGAPSPCSFPLGRAHRAAGCRPVRRRTPARRCCGSPTAARSGCRRLRLVLRADEACTADAAREALPHARAYRCTAGVRRAVRLRATRKGARRLRRAVARSGRRRVAVRLAARDAAGNVRVRRVRLGVR